MQRQLLAAVVCLVFTSQCALARGDYKVNPHAPNGYNASMAGYHYHGTHAPSGEMNGYAASSIRSKHGAQPLLVPNTPSGGGGRFSGGGGGRFSNRFGGGGEQSSGRFSNRFGGGESDTGRFANRYNGGNYSGARFGATSYGANSYGVGSYGVNSYGNHSYDATSYGATAYGAASSGGNDYWAQHFRNNCQPQYAGATAQTQYDVQQYQPALRHPAEQIAGATLTASALARRNQTYSTSSTALRTMVNNRPMQNLIHSSAGGFNRIYTTE